MLTIFDGPGRYQTMDDPGVQLSRRLRHRAQRPRLASLDRRYAGAPPTARRGHAAQCRVQHGPQCRPRARRYHIGCLLATCPLVTFALTTLLCCPFDSFVAQQVEGPHLAPVGRPQIPSRNSDLDTTNNAIAKAVRAARGNYRFRRQPRAELSAHDRNRLKLKPANKM